MQQQMLVSFHISNKIIWSYQTSISVSVLWWSFNSSFSQKQMSEIFRWRFLNVQLSILITTKRFKQRTSYLFISLFGKFTFDFQFSIVFLLFVDTLGNLLGNQNKNAIGKSSLFLILFPSYYFVACFHVRR